MQLCLLIGSENFTFSKEHFLSQPNCCWRNKKHRLEKNKKSLSSDVKVNSLLLFRCKVNVFYKQLQLFSHSKCPLSRGLSWCLLILLISRWQQENILFISLAWDPLNLEKPCITFINLCGVVCCVPIKRGHCVHLESWHKIPSASCPVDKNFGDVRLFQSSCSHFLKIALYP